MKVHYLATVREYACGLGGWPPVPGPHDDPPRQLTGGGQTWASAYTVQRDAVTCPDCLAILCQPAAPGGKEQA